MKKDSGKARILAMGLVAALLSVGAASAQASAKRSLEEMKHALGWDTINLKVIEKDKAERATLEREDNAANRVERKTSYHDNGRKSAETVTVVSNGSGKTLYVGKKAWMESGDPASVTVEDDVFSDGGKQLKGVTVAKEFKYGRLVEEERKRYSAKKGWSPSFKQTISYYEDGDMKERVTEELASKDKEKVRETWGPKLGDAGRKASTEKWNWTKGSWN
jgi:hypothetical protein